MIQARGFFATLSIDIGRYTKTLDQTMDVQMRQAARAWLRAVILKVPVWTGMSRGSFKPLGAFLRVAIPISPVATRSGMGPDAGASLSSFSFGKEGTKYIFEFEDNVPHYAINEFYNVRPPINLITPGPYGSFKAGQDAWDQYVTQVMPSKFPRPEEFIRQRRIQIAGH